MPKKLTSMVIFDGRRSYRVQACYSNHKYFRTKQMARCYSNIQLFLWLEFAQMKNSTRRRVLPSWKNPFLDAAILQKDLGGTKSGKGLGQFYADRLARMIERNAAKFPPAHKNHPYVAALRRMARALDWLLKLLPSEPAKLTKGEKSALLTTLIARRHEIREQERIRHRKEYVVHVSKS